MDHGDLQRAKQLLIENERALLRSRFGLHDDQFFAFFRHKNLQWFLNGKNFGFGDLRDEDINRIHEQLSDTEVFEGFNEHHGSRFQQTDFAIIKITAAEITFPSAERGLT